MPEHCIDHDCTCIISLSVLIVGICTCIYPRLRLHLSLRRPVPIDVLERFGSSALPQAMDDGGKLREETPEMRAET